jgi:homoserine dehydrogenase
MLAHHGNELARLAAKNNVSLAFEAAVAGGIPILKALREGLAANRIERIYGILNGTCNYILTQMRDSGRDFGEVLKEAQKLGYAEADPSFDIDGIDTAHKLAILAAVAFGGPVDFKSVHVEGIRHVSALDIEFAEELGFRIKLLGLARQTAQGLEQPRPCLHGAAQRRRSRMSRASSTRWWSRATSPAASCWKAAAPAPSRRPPPSSPTSSTSRMSAAAAPSLHAVHGLATEAQARGADGAAHAAPITCGSWWSTGPGVIADIAGGACATKKVSMEQMIQRGRAAGRGSSRGADHARYRRGGDAPRARVASRGWIRCASRRA